MNSLVRVDGGKRCENATIGREFFGRRRKKVAFSNEYGYAWTGPKSSLLVKIKDACTIPYCNAITKLTDQSENQLKLMHECYTSLLPAISQALIIYFTSAIYPPSFSLQTLVVVNQEVKQQSSKIW